MNPFKRVHSFSVPCTILGLSLLINFGYGQNGLRDIPSTKIEDQLVGFKLPEGAKINLFAAEPLVKKPVHMNWDSKGRLWVVSSPMYPHIKPGQEEEDKLVILEDLDGDGKADTSTIFADDLHIPTAVLPGNGGAYVANSTEMLFLKDTDGDGLADQRRIVLSGFGTEDTHHILHTFRWGPGGRIWMNQSIYIHSHLETPYGIRRLLGGGMWHFRPETQRAEVYMKGLINPWGHAFDEWGQSFLTDGAGSQGINWAFSGAVFRTSPGATRVVQGLNSGQPKLCGLEVLSGEHIPEEYRGQLAAPDFRGHRINRYELSDNGTSGYQSKQVADLLANTHRAFRPIDIKMGPDGAIYIADWYNPIIQHGEVDFRDERRDGKHGRIWRVSFPNRKLDKRADFDSMNEQALASLSGPVGWNEQMATVELMKRDRAAAAEGVKLAWGDAITEQDKLHVLMASQAINQIQESWAFELATQAEIPEVRAGALRVLHDFEGDAGKAREVCLKAVSDPHPRVRLWGVCTLNKQKFPGTVQTALRALEGIEVDEYLDFAVWQICREHSHKWLPETEEGNPFESPSQLLFALRAVGSNKGANLILDSFENGEMSSDKDIAGVADWISRSGDANALGKLYQRARSNKDKDTETALLLNSLVSAAKLRKAKPSGDITQITGFLKSKNPRIFSSAAQLSGYWKVESARSILREEFSSKDGKRSASALEGLRLFGGAGTSEFLQQLASNELEPDGKRIRALNALTKFNPKAASETAVDLLPKLKNPESSKSVFNTFLANKTATNLLSKSLNNGAKLPEAIAKIGLQQANSSATRPDVLIKSIQKAGGIKQMKSTLTAEEMAALVKKVQTVGDPCDGQEIYRRTSLQCVYCHAIGDAGGVIGPNLVSIGASAPIDYLIESLIEPNKKIKEGYHTTLVTLKNNNTYAGALVKEDQNELVIRDMAGQENRIPKGEVKTKTISPISLMPPGLTSQLREDEFVDLVRFLSELGKEGAFKTQPTPYLRTWEVLMPHERTRDEIGHYGAKIFAEDFKGYQWLPFTAQVNGDLSLNEMPSMMGRGSRYGVARIRLKTTEQTDLRLKIKGKKSDITIFLDDVQLPVLESVENALNFDVGMIVDPGEHRLTFVGLKGKGLENFRVQVVEQGKVTFPK